MSARLRLTLSYAGFLLASAIGFFALLFYILRFIPDAALSLNDSYVPDRSDLLDALWPRVWQVLTVLTIVGFGGGWLLAGRMLRPLQRINGVARRVAAGSFDKRVRLEGPHDEFRELAETFDSMLDRLQSSLDEQRRFAGNAAHELRTPYAIERSMLDVALADPSGVDVHQLVRRLDETNRRGIEVVEALLALASLDAPGRFSFAPVDVAETVSGVIRDLRPVADAAGVTIAATLGECDIDGSETLVRQLAANLILNGIRHNLDDDGWITVRTETTTDGRVELAVANSGRPVPPELIEHLTEPFVRGAGRVGTRAASEGAVEGSGLGLALVARVAEVHGATLELRDRADGGLAVTVRFPAPGAPVG
jgi:two-component system sensor histidine kinase VanS